MVQVMSRGWTASSIRVPTSAGVMSFGGSYMGATEMSGWGSRPFVHQKKNITTNAHSGSSTIGLLRRNPIVPRRSQQRGAMRLSHRRPQGLCGRVRLQVLQFDLQPAVRGGVVDRKSTRLNSSHLVIS